MFWTQELMKGDLCDIINFRLQYIEIKNRYNDSLKLWGEISGLNGFWCPLWTEQYLFADFVSDMHTH